MICNVKMKNGDCSGNLGTENYCKDTTLVSIVIAIKTFGSLDTRNYRIHWQGQPGADSGFLKGGVRIKGGPKRRN